NARDDTCHPERERGILGGARSETRATDEHLSGAAHQQRLRSSRLLRPRATCEQVIDEVEDVGGSYLAIAVRVAATCGDELRGVRKLPGSDLMGLSICV